MGAGRCSLLVWSLTPVAPFCLLRPQRHPHHACPNRGVLDQGGAGRGARRPVGGRPTTGAAVAAVALASRYGIQAWHAFKARPYVPRMRKFYEGGFQPTMTRREAALILGVRESATADKVKEAHRKVMVANHPDAGGSHYLASKTNEAKDVLLGKTKGSGSAF